MIDAVCNFCNSSGPHSPFTAREMMAGTWKEFLYFECTHCKSLQIVSVPSDLAQHYEAGYYSFLAPAKSSVYRYALSIYDRLSYKFGRLPVLMPISAPGASVFQALRVIGAKLNSRVLDVGCGAGVLLGRLAAAGFTELSGVDAFLPSPITTQHINIKVGQISNIRDHFDVIMFNHSLEHIYEPVASLSMAAKLLSPNGAIIVRTPLAGKYAWRTYKNNWIQLDAPRHLNIPSSVGMAQAAITAGLQVRDTIYDSSDFQIAGSERYVARTEGRVDADAPAPRDKRRKWKRMAYRLNKSSDGDQAAFILRAMASP